MKKLSKEKKMHLILVGLVTAGIIAGLWVGLISMQKDKLADIARRSKSVKDDIDKMQHVITASSQVKLDLEAATNHLGSIEGTMASGDLYYWVNSTLKRFNVPTYKVEIPQYGTPNVGPVKMLADFPYTQASVNVTGSAYYYDLGKFIAALENHFPYFRVENVTLEPGVGSNPDDRERLFFRMDIITLVKPSAS